MISCEKEEAKGRAGFLHAICSVFECLPWTEARAFHNLVLTKIEQGWVTWADDFVELANQFLDKKLRQSLRSKGSAVGGSNFFSKNKDVGKGFGGYNRGRYGYNNYSANNFNSNYSNSNRNNALYATVCRQFNFDRCTFGDRCRKWHVCWTCAEAGKLGEQHKASSHNNSTSSSRPNNGV